MTVLPESLKMTYPDPNGRHEETHVYAGLWFLFPSPLSLIMLITTVIVGMT